MSQQSSSTCEICRRGVASRFLYRTLNGARRREEPLCEHCAAMLADLPSVDDITPAPPPVSRAERGTQSD